MKTTTGYLTALLVIILSGYACKKDTEATNPTPDTDMLYFPPLSGTAWETTAPEDLDWDTSKIPGLLQFLQAGNTHAFILLKDGRIVIEEYFGKDLLGIANFNATSNWYWASAGKTLTVFTVGLAQEDGFLDIEDRSSCGHGRGAILCGNDQYFSGYQSKLWLPVVVER